MPSITEQLSRSELRERLQTAMDNPECRAPSHRLIWEPEGDGGYIDSVTGLRYARGRLIKGHRRPRRKRTDNLL